MNLSDSIWNSGSLGPKVTYLYVITHLLLFLLIDQVYINLWCYEEIFYIKLLLKGVPVTLLLRIISRKMESGPTTDNLGIAAVFIFALAGDLFLIFPGKVFFGLGMSSFIIAHIYLLSTILQNNTVISESKIYAFMATFLIVLLYLQIEISQDLKILLGETFGIPKIIWFLLIIYTASRIQGNNTNLITLLLMISSFSLSIIGLLILQLRVPDYLILPVMFYSWILTINWILSLTKFICISTRQNLLMLIGITFLIISDVYIGIELFYKYNTENLCVKIINTYWIGMIFILFTIF